MFWIRALAAAIAYIVFVCASFLAGGLVIMPVIAADQHPPGPPDGIYGYYFSTWQLKAICFSWLAAFILLAFLTYKQWSLLVLITPFIWYALFWQLWNNAADDVRACVRDTVACGLEQPAVTVTPPLATPVANPP